MSVDIWGTNCSQCVSMVQCCFTSIETVSLIRTGSWGRLPRLSHSSWAELCFSVLVKIFQIALSHYLQPTNPHLDASVACVKRYTAIGTRWNEFIWLVVVKLVLVIKLVILTILHIHSVNVSHQTSNVQSVLRVWYVYFLWEVLGNSSSDVSPRYVYI